MAARTATKKPRVRKTATKKRATPAEKSPTDQNTARMASPIPEMMEKPPETPPEMIQKDAENPVGASQTGGGFDGERGNLGAYETVDAVLEKPQVAQENRDIAHGDFIGRNTFFGTFLVAVSLPALTVKAIKKVELQSLQVSTEDPTTRAASDALYDLIYDAPSLHFIILSESKFYQNLGIVLAFVAPMVLGGLAEYREIQEGDKTIEGTATEVPAQKPTTPAPPPPSNKPANDDTPVYCDAMSAGIGD